MFYLKDAGWNVNGIEMPLSILMLHPSILIFIMETDQNREKENVTKTDAQILEEVKDLHKNSRSKKRAQLMKEKEN